MSDRTIITLNVPCEVIDEIESGNCIYLDRNGEVRWVDGHHIVTEADHWKYTDV